MTKVEIVESIREILRANADDPATEIIKHGEALVGIGKALKGLPLRDSKAIIESVMALERS
jgi:actin-like ATPase involved in cell morphogenesis